MKTMRIGILALVALIGCGEPQESATTPETEPSTPTSEVTEIEDSVQTQTTEPEVITSQYLNREASSTYIMPSGLVNHGTMSQGAPVNVTYTATPAYLNDEELIIHKLVNQQRYEAGLTELETDGFLCQLARAHSERMAGGMVSFGHDGFDERADQIWDEIGGAYIGENVAYNWLGGEDAVDQWMNSSGHKANILKDSFTLTGIGVIQGNDGNYYCTQIFLQR